MSEELVWGRTKIFSESPWSQWLKPNAPKAYTDTMKRDNLLGRLWLIYNTMSNVMVSFVAKFWQFNPESQAAWKDASDSGYSIPRLLDVPNGSNKPFHRDAGPSVLKGTRGNKGGSEVISPHWVQPSGFTLSPLNGQNATGRAGMKENKQADVFGERMERGRGAELLNFHSRFSERSEWWIIETWKVIKYGSLKRWGQVPKTPAETEGSGSQ